MNRKPMWITAPQDMEQVCPEFRYTYTVSGEVKSAVAYVTALGLYEMKINGAKVGDAVLTPGWTSYTNRVQMQEYDITSYLGQENLFAICVGTGWYCGAISRTGKNRERALWARICVTYADGRAEEIVTDTSWDVFTSQILFADIYHGETVDKTSAQRFVCKAIEAVKDPKPEILPQVGEWIREHERVAACELIVTPKGERVIDFGQNMAGYVEIHVRGKKGERVCISHAEIIGPDGNFYNDNLRNAKNRIEYVLSGDGEEVFKPTFSFQGFRYIRLDEYPDVEISLSDFYAVAIYSDMRRTGSFSCGYPKLNQLYSNIVWGQRSNFIDVPTDCPQRDERYGWTGDAQIFCRTAAINYDVERFFTKWIGDMALEQDEDGGIPAIIPMVETAAHRISTAWADVSVICPWEIYRAYGNKKILRDNFEMMKKWIGYMRAFGEEEYLYIGGYHYGDWVAMDAGYGQYVGATQTDMIASAFYAFSTSLLIKVGEVLGEDVSEYRELYTKVRSAFREAFMKDGMPILYPKADALTKERPVLGVTQTAIVLILHFDLCEENEREALVEKLVEMIGENDGRMTTGFVGTPYILHALSENGRADVAFDLLLQEKNPSWLFSVNQGATTIWEHWDCIREDGTLWSTHMNSFNHYAYGSVYDWMFGVMLGIDVCEDGAGYTKITYTPHADRRIGHANGAVETRQGRIESSWRFVGENKVRYELTVPNGTVATVCIPGVAEHTVSGGTFVYHAEV